MTEQAPSPGARQPLSRRNKIALGVAGALVAIPVIAIVIVLTFDWNRARPWLNARIGEAIERPFAINGDLVVKWEQPSQRMAPGERTWRDHIPWPHLIANDVHVGNPAGLPQRDMASVRQFSFSLNPFALLGRSISIPVLRFDAPAVELLRTDPQHNNWTFKKQEGKQPSWTLDLQRIVLAKGVLRLDDAVTKTQLTADIDTLPNNPTYGIGWTLRGSHNGARVSGNGKAGAVLSLQRQGTPYPVQADVRSGATRIQVEGTVTRPAQLAALDLKLKLQGNSMARLYNFTGLVLPETAAYSTDGRLVGAIDAKSSRWTYDNFKGKVGSSDIAGRLEFQTGKPRGTLSGNVNSRQLMFADLAPLIGADSNENKVRRGVEPVQPEGKVLPVERFKTERWKSLDANVRYLAERIVREKQLPITKLSTHLVLKDGVLSLEPLDFGIAGGTLKSNVRLDGSRPKEPIKATAKVAARHIQIKQLFPAVEKIQGTTVGEINGDAQLSAVGDSVASMLGNSNGELKTLVNQGTVSKLLLEQMGLNVANIIITELFGDKPVQLNCLAADFDAVKGVLHTRLFVVDTEEALVTLEGTVNLKSEGLNLTLRPQTKGLRLFSLRAPIYVRGPFNKPDVEIDKGVLAMRIGSAAALAAAAPAAALLPLISAGPGEDSACGRLLAQAKEKPTAPPPGKTKQR